MFSHEILFAITCSLTTNSSTMRSGKISQIDINRHQFNFHTNQDGGGRLLGHRKSYVTLEPLDRFPPNLTAT